MELALDSEDEADEDEEMSIVAQNARQQDDKKVQQMRISLDKVNRFSFLIPFFLKPDPFLVAFMWC